MILNWGLVRLLAGIMLNFIQCFCNTIPQVTFEFNQFSKEIMGLKGTVVNRTCNL